MNELGVMLLTAAIATVIGCALLYFVVKAAILKALEEDRARIRYEERARSSDPRA